jgi:cation diffusion facilitator CzcD-associated flavoprotein CzcO
MSVKIPDVAVIGAGPYGLSVAAHLQERGLSTRIFGQPMSFWRKMHPSINLKSFAWATNVYVPRPSYTFPEYCRARGLPDLEPCTMASFAAYGQWVQREVLPHADPVEVTDVRAHAGGFEITLADRERLLARRVVMAVGLTYFAHLPHVLEHLPDTLVSHTGQHTDLAHFAGKDVAVIGAGASALEAATILHEAGARPVLIARCESLVFHTRFDPGRSIAERFRNPNSVLGPGRKSWVLGNFPMLLHYVPQARRVRFTRAYLGPSGPWWLRERWDEARVPVHLRSEVDRATPRGDRLSLEVRSADGRRTTLEVDHVLAGTGYEPDVDRLTLLDPGLRARIDRVERGPALSRHFESSVPGLYFVGPATAFSFGPLFRFVAGAQFAAPAVARHVASQPQRRVAIAVPPPPVTTDGPASHP